MLIDLSELFFIKGKAKEYTVPLELEIFCDGMNDYKVADRELVRLVITNQGDRFFAVTGETRLSLWIPCARCLEPVKVPFLLEFDQELDLNLTDEARMADLNEQFYLNGCSLDIDQLVSSELMLNLPMRVLCSDNCKGICNRCGTNLNRGACDCAGKSLDPRMSVIQDIFKQLKEV